MRRPIIETTKPPTYLFRYLAMSKSVATKSTGGASFLGARPANRVSKFLFAFSCLRFRLHPVAVCSASVRRYLRIGAGVRKRVLAKNFHFL